MSAVLLATLLVLNKADATLAFVDPTNMAVVAKIATGNGPHEVAVTGDAKTAIVANYGTGPEPGTTLSVVDVAARAERKRLKLPVLRPHGLYAVGQRVWFTAEGAKAVASYDPASAKIDWIMGTGQNRTHMIYVTPDEKQIYTTNVSSATVSILEKITLP